MMLIVVSLLLTILLLTDTSFVAHHSMISPRAVTDLHAAACHPSEAPPQPSLLAAASDYKLASELRRLQQENMQLRRDLDDANNRIRELELKQCSTSLFMPSSSYDADSDDFSVEAVLSVTSSTTTVPMGSLTKNQEDEQVKRQPEQQRDDQETSLSDIIKTHGASYHRLSRQSRRHRNPFAQVIPRQIPELRRLFSSESETSSSSLNTQYSSDVVVNTVPAVSRRGQEPSSVSSYAMNYFQRAESTEDDDDAPSTDGSSGLMFEV